MYFLLGKYPARKVSSFKRVQTTRVNPVFPNMEFVDCFQSRNRLCSEIVAFPILVSRRYSTNIPAMFYYTPSGIRYPRMGDATWLLPWDDKFYGFPILVGKYGPIFGMCDYRVNSEAGRTTIKIECLGEPDEKYKRLINSTARFVGGWRIQWRIRRVYDESVLPLVASRIKEICESGRKLIVYWGPYMLIPLSALAYLLEVDRKNYIGTCVTLNWLPSLDDRFRNMVKRALDYMCANGDAIACYASKVIHHTLYKYFFRSV